MSNNITYNIRIDKRIRTEADKLYKKMGMSLSAAINLFLTQSVIQGKMPIAEIIAEPDFADTVLSDVSETEKEIRNGTAKIYKTPDLLFAAWNEDNEQI